VTVGFDDEGRLLALRDQFVHDTGAYTPRGLVVPLLSASMLAGPYRIPNVEVTFDSVYTHRVPVTPYRGAGQPQAVFVIERVMDLIARETDATAPPSRFANLVPAGPTCRTTSGCRTIAARANVVYEQRRLSGRPSPRDGDVGLRAAGEGMPARPSGRPSARARRRVLRGADRRGPVRGRDDSRRRRGDAFTVFTGVPSQGQGLETTLAQVRRRRARRHPRTR